MRELRGRARAEGQSVSFRITTLASPLHIAAFNAGKSKAAKKPKPFKAGPRMVEQLTSFDMSGRAEWLEMQLPILTNAENATGNFAHGRGVLFARQKRASVQIDAVLVALQTNFRALDRERINAITLTRVSPGKLDAHDNLRQAFKHVLDGVCAWIVCGDGEINRHAIGKYDDKLLGSGKVICNYEQTTHETDKRLQGIRIRLHLCSP